VHDRGIKIWSQPQIKIILTEIKQNRYDENYRKAINDFFPSDKDVYNETYNQSQIAGSRVREIDCYEEKCD
jgi:hypothetical protein